MWRSSAGRGAAPLDCRFIVESRRRQGRAARSLPLTSTGCNDTFPSIVTILKFSKQQCNQLHCWKSRWNPCFIACFVGVVKRAMKVARVQGRASDINVATNRPGRPAKRGRTGRGKGFARAAKRRRPQTITREPGQQRPPIRLEQGAPDGFAPARAARGAAEGRPAQRRQARRTNLNGRGRGPADERGDDETGKALTFRTGGRAPGADAQHFADPQTKSIVRAPKRGSTARRQEACRAAGDRTTLPNWIIDQAARRSAPGADRARLQPVRDGAQGRRRRASLTCPLTCPLTFPLPLWRLSCLFVRDSPFFAPRLV